MNRILMSRISEMQSHTRRILMVKKDEEIPNEEKCTIRKRSVPQP